MTGQDAAKRAEVAKILKAALRVALDELENTDRDPFAFIGACLVEAFTQHLEAAVAEAVQPWREARDVQVAALNRLGLLGSPVEELERLAEAVKERAQAVTDSVAFERKRQTEAHVRLVAEAERARERALDMYEQERAKREQADTRVVEAVAQAVQAARHEWNVTKPIDAPPVCIGCGGPHPFDTSVPSEAWNRVIRDRGLPDYLCTTCIIRAFVLAGEGFTATLWGDEFPGIEIAMALRARPTESAKK